MTTPTLGRLTRVDLRAAWKNEATHFTPWLAQPDNLALLAEAMGLTPDALELQAQEQSVGPFRADILCQNTEDNALVLIENQLERTDHGHLGQLLTYAAGLKAVTLVWIAERFTDEHRATLDWLNEITDEGFHIFGFEIELWRIGDSPPAPKFNVVVQPNEWTRTVQNASKAGPASTPVGQMQVAYWAAFGEYLTTKKATFRPPKPYPSNWMSWGLGRAGVGLLAFVHAGHIAVGIDVNSREHPTWFARLLVHKAEVEEATGFDLDWDEKPGNKFSSLRCRMELDMRDEANWPKAHQWMLERLAKLREAFRPLVKDLDDEPLTEGDPP
jgi:hypothetical protein